MNQGTVTGGVIRGAASAYTATPPRRRRVVFTIMVTNSRHERAPWNCEAEGDDATLDFIESQAQPGRGVKLDYELAARPYVDPKTKIHKGEVRFLRVLNAEFAPERGAAVPAHAGDEEETE